MNTKMKLSLTRSQSEFLVNGVPSSEETDIITSVVLMLLHQSLRKVDFEEGTIIDSIAINEFGIHGRSIRVSYSHSVGNHRFTCIKFVDIDDIGCRDQDQIIKESKVVKKHCITCKTPLYDYNEFDDSGYCTNCAEGETC